MSDLSLSPAPSAVAPAPAPAAAPTPLAPRPVPAAAEAKTSETEKKEDEDENEETTRPASNAPAAPKVTAVGATSSDESLGGGFLTGLLPGDDDEDTSATSTGRSVQLLPTASMTGPIAYESSPTGLPVPGGLGEVVQKCSAGTGCGTSWQKWSGIGVGTTVALVLAAFVIYKLCRRRRNKRYEGERQSA